jgi:hypothetical protein
MAFSLLDAHLPEDLADSIARTVHKYNMENVAPSIRSVMRSMLSEGNTTFVDRLREMYPGLKVYKDDYMYYFTAVVFLDDTNIVIFHSYYDDPIHSEVAIAEATIKDDTVIVRNCSVVFSYIDVVTSDYFERNRIPLGFISDTLQRKLTIMTEKTVALPQVDDWLALEEAFRTM